MSVRILQHLDTDEPDHHARMVEVLTVGFTLESERNALLAEHKHALIYQGLDGNDSREGKMASYVEFVQSTGRWTDLREDVEAADGGNSHSPMLSTYLAMLDAYQPIWKEAMRNPGGSRYLLSAEQLRQVAASWG